MAVDKLKAFSHHLRMKCKRNFATCIATSAILGNLPMWPFGVVIYDLLFSILFIFVTLDRSTIKKLTSFFYELKDLAWREKVILFFLIFLVVNDFRSILQYPTANDFRMLALHLVLAYLFILFRANRPSDLTSLRLLALGIIYFSVYSLYLVILQLIGSDWRSLQGIVIAGSSAASLVIFPLLIAISQKLDKTRHMIISLLLFGAILFSASIFDSRMTGRVCYIFVILVIFTRGIRIKSKFFVTCVLLAFVFIPYFAALIGDTEANTPNPKAATVQATLSYLKGSTLVPLVETTNLFENSEMNGDRDRLRHIICALEVNHDASSVNRLFGYGTNMHKVTLYQCDEFGGTAHKLTHKDFPGNFRTISTAAFLVNYGLLGCFLIFLLLFHTIVTHWRKWTGTIFSTMYILALASTVLAEISGSLLLWMFIFWYFPTISEPKQGKIIAQSQPTVESSKGINNSTQP